MNKPLQVVVTYAGGIEIHIPFSDRWYMYVTNPFEVLNYKYLYEDDVDGK